MSNLLISYYRDLNISLLEIITLVNITIIFYPLFYTLLFLLFISILKIVFYVFYEIFYKVGILSLYFHWYLIYLTGYVIMYYNFGKFITESVDDLRYYKRMDFSILRRKLPVFNFVVETVGMGFTHYLTLFYNFLFLFSFIFLCFYLFFFSSLFAFSYSLVLSIFSLIYIKLNMILVQQVIFILFFIIFLLLVVAYYTLLERKVMGSVQRRTGPKFVGYWGILQPISDGLKLLVKEIILVRDSNVLLFILAPIASFIIAIVLWSVIPFGNGVVISDFSLGLFFIFSVSSLNVYGVMLGGWSSRSQYSLVGALRATSQVISYELSFGFLFLVIRLITGTFNLQTIVLFQYLNIWLFFLLFPFLLVFLIVMLAETNRAPYDLAEAEAELVAGFHTEYSAILFALFFLAEYANMFLMSTLGALLFLGGWLHSRFNFIDPIICNLFFAEFLYIDDSFNNTIRKFFINISGYLYLDILLLMFKTLIFAMFFIIIRSALPRYRFDQLLSIGWKRLLPVSFALFIFYLLLKYLF